MRTLLVIAPTNALSQAIRVALNAEAYRIIDHESLKGDELRHMASSIDVCIVDAELTSIEAIRTIELYRHALPHCPMILYASHSQWDWEEDAYLLGVNHILTKPVRGKLLHSLMDRILAKTPGNEPHATGQPSSPAPTPAHHGRGTIDPGAMPGSDAGVVAQLLIDPLPQSVRGAAFEGVRAFAARNSWGQPRGHFSAQTCKRP